MAQPIDPQTKRPRISIDIEPGLRRQLRLAAAKRDVTVGQYVLEAIDARLLRDAADDGAASAPLTATSDPVLAELWDNEQDAAYDHLSSR